MDKGDYDAAEAAPKAALTVDVMFGPADNNLGKVYFHKGELYLAARRVRLRDEADAEPAGAGEQLGDGVRDARPPGRRGQLLRQGRGPRAGQRADPGQRARACAMRVRRGEHDPDLVGLLNKLVAETRPDWLAWEQRELLRRAQPPAELPRDPPSGG